MTRQRLRNASNLIVISDLHCGCKLGLCPPEGVPLDDGGRYMPSRLQLIVWEWWKEFWGEWVPRVCHNEPFDLVINGDGLEGVHHGSTTQVSHNLGDQARVAKLVLEPVIARARKLYWVRGTEAHVGPSGVDEERLAKELGATPNADGQFARWELWKRVGNAQGPLCHIMHHIGSSGSASYESTAPQAELIAEFAEAGQNREEPPDYVIRSHRHRYIKVENPSARFEAAAIVTPGWQLKTPFSFKIRGGRVSPPQFGGILIRQGDEEFYSRHIRWTIERPAVEET